jgi:hypothetical protein
VLIHLRKWVRRARGSLSTLGLTGLTIAAFAAYAVAIVLLAHSLPGGTDDNAQTGNGTPRSSSGRGDAGPARAPRFPASDYRQRRFPTLTGEPLIGVNYTHYAFRHCSFNDTGILASYHEPGVAQKVHAQLFQMRKAGVATVRTIIWHMTDASNESWGPISSAGGTLQEPYRSNLIHYLTEIRRFRFARLTVSFAPQKTNNPLVTAYNPRKLQENWRFIRTVRSLVERYGPSDTRIDLLNEGAPSEMPSQNFPRPWQVSPYLRVVYRLYVERFGSQDVMVSTIAPTYPGDVTNRLQNLIDILKSTHEPLPRWYEVHIPYDQARALFALRNVDAVLNNDREHQPLVIGETAYDNGGVAKGIRDFLQSSARRIDEVSTWYLRAPGSCNVSPPYKPGAYGREFHARVGR